jgi:hypothetical protein
MAALSTGDEGYRKAIAAGGKGHAVQVGQRDVSQQIHVP